MRLNSQSSLNGTFISQRVPLLACGGAASKIMQGEGEENDDQEPSLICWSMSMQVHRHQGGGVSCNWLESDDN